MGSDLILEWNDKYSIHNDRIDAQHKHLFELGKKANTLIHQQVGSSEIKEILGQLFDYMKIHFHDEEAYMEEIGYPELPQHREIHKDIIQRMVDLIQNIKYDFKQKLAIIMNDWLIGHIMGDDMKIEQWHKNELAKTNTSPNTSNMNLKSKDSKANTKNEQYKTTIQHYYRCNCRKSFRLLETIHKKIQAGKTYHCKKCNGKIVFLYDKEKAT